MKGGGEGWLFIYVVWIETGFYPRRVRVARPVGRSGAGSPAGLDRVGMPGWDKLVMEDIIAGKCVMSMR